MSAQPAQATLAANGPKTSARTIQNFIGGRWADSSATSFGEVHNPATGELLARVPLGGRADVDAAVAAATRAFPAWRATPPVNRVRTLFALRESFERHFEELSTLVTLEHGKTLDESRSSIRRAIDNIEVACAIPTTMQGRALEDIAAGIDCYTYRQPLGVFAAITPFNFPAMVPMWFLPHAIACGNTFIVKPSERVPLSQVRIFELLHEAGVPEGVVNLVHGAKDAVDAILDHPGIAGVSFVGSTPVARHVYERGAQSGKRVQALGGAKNFVLVMPDADMGRAAQISTESCFGCAGERCLANSVVLGVGTAYEEMSKRLVEEARRIRVGNGLEPGVTMGPVISEAHREKVLSYIAKGIHEGATLALDGRSHEDPKHPSGYFLGPCVFTDVKPDMVIAREEIFGPVLCVMKADTFDEAIEIVKRHELGNASSIFTSSGKAARDYRWQVEPSMLGVNIGVAAPMAFFPFGGAKGSFFGDLKAHGQDAVEFYTDKKVSITRWF
jgi:malonate-semialdehyde dehydrogenase (acetylating) / methylmalonate-semialdehyde dehydrogenase